MADELLATASKNWQRRQTQPMHYGYTGKILKVDLSRRQVEIEERDDAFYRRYLGGRALAIHYLLNEMAAGADPLGPQNLLIFAPGVLTGAAVSGQGRNGVAAKSPLTGGLGSSEGGGHWAYELKRAGFDAVVVRGQASSPVYLWVKDGQAAIRDAEHLWGLTVGDCEDAMRDELGDGAIRTTLIGPAGENLVRYAAVANDRNHFAGRTGLGAVMGSKRLKGIAVRSTPGQSQVKLADPASVREVAHWLGSNLDRVAGLYDTGTAGGVRNLSADGGLPTWNFQAGHFDGDDKINGHVMRDTILIGRDTCAACAVRCKRVVEVGEPYNVDPRYGGPEYESLAALGSCTGVDDLLVLAKANEMCAAYGLDTISTGVSVAFAMECFENGLLTEADTGGLALRWGDGALLLRLIEQVARREGFGDSLAEGVARMAARIGQGAEAFALHVKGQELPMHEPRLKHALGVGYALSPTGADHMHNFHDTLYRTEGSPLDKLRAFDPDLQPMAATALNEDKMRLYFYHVNYRHFLDSAVMCMFLPYTPEQMVTLVNAATGWDIDLAEIQAIGRRAVTLSRVFNLREGFTAADDTLPRRFFAPFLEGQARRTAPLDEAAFEEAKRTYYRMMGWDQEAGVPSLETLKELDVAWAAEHLPD
jgi:aldehyde:ferredoxin oxidoreductase